MFRFLALSAALMALAPLSASADPVVIELFGSRNCAECPKANRTLARVKDEDQDVLILSWSVDYWDFLGERDARALPEAMDRQRAYADRMRLRGPYTPQTVYNGEKQCPGNRYRDVVDRIRDSRSGGGASQTPVLTRTEGGLAIDGPIGWESDVFLVEFEPEATDEEGLVNAVTSVRRLGGWSGGPVSFAVDCELGCAVLVQEADYGEIKGALRLQ